jgi:hypothetical protein
VSCGKKLKFNYFSMLTFPVKMGKNPKLWVLVRVRVLSKAGSVRVRVLCLPSKFGFGSVRVLRDCGFGSGSSS